MQPDTLEHTRADYHTELSGSACKSVLLEEVNPNDRNEPSVGRTTNVPFDGVFHESLTQ